MIYRLLKSGLPIIHGELYYTGNFFKHFKINFI